MKKLLVTGSSGLIGSEVCSYFAPLGWQVTGADNNGRAAFFGPQGDTRWNQSRLVAELPGFVHCEVDIRDRAAVLALLEEVRPDAIVHTAAQPSHDLAAAMPFEDFDTNAVGTMNLLGVGNFPLAAVTYSAIITVVVLVAGAFSLKSMERKFADVI